MLHRLQTFAMKNPLWILFLVLLFILFGANAITKLPVDAVPDITGIQVMVQTKTGAMDPEQSEALVTYPIEVELAGIQDVREIRSITKYGLSLVTIVFEDHADLYLSRQLIAERLQGLQGSLPDGIDPKLGPISTGLGEVFMYAVKAKPGTPLASMQVEDRLRYLRTVQDWVIRPAMKTVPGVAEVDSNGGYLKGVFIEFHPDRMRQNGIGPATLADALQNVGLNSGGGYIEPDMRRVLVRSDARFRTIDEIRHYPIRPYAVGPTPRLDELADVRDGSLPRVGAATENGDETVLGTVLMRIGANSRDVARESETKLSTIPLPEDVQVEILYSRTELVNATVATVEKNLVEGGILVIVILLLLLGNLRAAIIVSLAIPLSMLIALMGMEEMGISANLMSLGAVDFGLIVDGAVVMIENIVRKMEEDPDRLRREGKFTIIADALREVTAPVVTGVLIIIVVYIPILGLTGVEGKMFRPMAITVLLALAASLVLALFVMPVLALLFLKEPKHTQSKLTEWIHRLYTPVLNFSLRRGRILTGASLGLFVISLFIFSRLGSEFLPDLDEQDLVVGMVRSPDISLTEMVKRQAHAEKVIREFEEVETVFSRIGTPESATDPMGINFADCFIILKKDRDAWPVIEELGRRRTKNELFDAISKRLSLEEDLAGDEYSPTQPIAMRFNEMLEGSRADASLRIFGPDLSKLMEYVQIAEEALSPEQMPQVREVGQDELSALRRTPLLDFKPDPEKMNRWGLNSRDIHVGFQYAMAGEEIGSFYEKDRRFPIVLRMQDRWRENIGLASRFPLDLPEGGVIGFRDVASFQFTDQVSTISRIDSRRYAGLSIYLEDRDLEGFIKKADADLRSKLNLPKEYHIEWAGQYKNLERARNRMLIIIPFTFFLIFILLLQNVKDLLQTLLILVGIPLATTGGILLLWMRGITFSVSATVGLIALSGIAVLNGTVLVNFFNQLRKEGYELYEAVHHGTLTRLRPVLMTALVAGLGFLPMALNTGVGAEVQRPLATIVVGGLFTSTVLTLLILPYLYLALERRREKRRQTRL
jgi:cobalt-zinc-cadmium resistance protein CzcA